MSFDSCGSTFSGFIARYIEQSGSRKSKPASKSTLSRLSPCASILTRHAPPCTNIFEKQLRNHRRFHSYQRESSAHRRQYEDKSTPVTKEEEGWEKSTPLQILEILVVMLRCCASTSIIWKCTNKDDVHEPLIFGDESKVFQRHEFIYWTQVLRLVFHSISFQNSTLRPHL